MGNFPGNHGRGWSSRLPYVTIGKTKARKDGPSDVPFNVISRRTRILAVALIAAAAAILPVRLASAEALLLVEASSGKVLRGQNATLPWYPASLSKLMTTYVTLSAMKARRITPNTLIVVSERAASQQPSKMGFKAGTELTIDNALKMLLVHSANDMAVALAEGVGGSVEQFAAMMNETARRLGMTQSHYNNPNGLPDPGQITSARDMAILARALIHDFPEYDFYWHVPAIKLGKRLMRNYNRLIDRYPGADGMKTGFICASGFNLVATATRHGRRLIAVVLGAPSSAARAQQAAQLLESGFNSSSALSWLTPSLGRVDELKPIAGKPVDLHDQICGSHRHHQVAESDEGESSGDNGEGVVLSALRSSYAKSPSLIGPLVESQPPVVVFVGPPKGQPAIIAHAPVPTRPPQPAASAPAAVTFSTAAISTSVPAKFVATKHEKAVPTPRPRPRLAKLRRKNRHRHK